MQLLLRLLARRKNVSVLFLFSYLSSFLILFYLCSLHWWFQLILNFPSLISAGKSSVLLDIKPWDDETDMKKLEDAVRSVQMEGLLWGACEWFNQICCLIV